MLEHLPWINHLAARELRMTLLEFNEPGPDEGGKGRLTEAEREEWRKFVLSGPSMLMDTLLFLEIRNVLEAQYTGAKTLDSPNERWIDGILEHPDAAWEKRMEDAKRLRRERKIASARALHEREQRGQINSDAGRE